MQNVHATEELIEYRAGLRTFQDRVAGTYSKIADPSHAQVGAWLSELLSISVSDIDRQLSRRTAHTGDLEIVRHGLRLATALMKTFESVDTSDPGVVKMTATMLKTVAAIGTNLHTSAFVIEHALTPASAGMVN